MIPGDISSSLATRSTCYMIMSVELSVARKLHVISPRQFVVNLESLGVWASVNGTDETRPCQFPSQLNWQKRNGEGTGRNEMAKPSMLFQWHCTNKFGKLF